MAPQESHHRQSKSKHPHRHRHHHREARHHSEDDSNSVSSDTADESVDDTIQAQTVPMIFNWSKPMLDAENTRFQYQARLTPRGYQWVISGAESGANPQYLPATPNSDRIYPQQSAAYTYHSGYYTGQPVHTQPLYYGPPNAGPNLAIPRMKDGSGDDKAGDYNDEHSIPDKNATKRTKPSNDYSSDEKNDYCHLCYNERRRRHRSHDSHHHHHHRSGSHEHDSRKKHTNRRSYINTEDKVKEWLQ
ncbi:hypothetical protein F5Y19DRAFT_454705 [Xylariaceae sp. FL1651]|nr:hypothetical protein F5Y19DRAFT_454705 [Xylariaceae sp. FL1651]